MKRMLLGAALAALVLGGSAVMAAQNNGNLRIYWIDVEGGASTLFVSPTGESLLFDTGNPGNGDRDAKRIFETAKKAGLQRIDHVVISHWHGDHVGGLEALSKMIPLGKFYDHGDGVEAADKARHDSYVSIAGSNRKVLKAGDMIALGPVQFRVMVSEGPVISTAINGGAANPLCANAPLMSPAGAENIRMVSLAMNYGSFKYASLADLDWSREVELVCPVNKLGSINLYTINRHGGLDDSGSPQLLGAVKPQVVIFNNGPRKGLGQKDERSQPINAATATPYERNSYLRVAKTPGNEGVWQLHRSMIDSDPAHNTTPDMIANMEQEGDQGFGLSAIVAPDGKFTVSNDRNNFSKSYVAH